MRKVFSTTLLCLSLLTINAQTTDELVAISGKMMRAQDSSLISGNILYEKLPYYDDMGMTSVSDDGRFEMQLVKGQTYNLSVSKTGYIKYEGQLTASEPQVFDIYVKEDIIELRKLENLLFASSSDRINSSSYEELDGLARWLNENPSIVIQLEGHTDFAGNADANLRLSEARVESVKEYLTTKGVKKTRIFTKAFGGTQPVSQERTDEAKALNRRVEVRVIRR